MAVVLVGVVVGGGIVMVLRRRRCGFLGRRSGGGSGSIRVLLLAPAQLLDERGALQAEQRGCGLPVPRRLLQRRIDVPSLNRAQKAREIHRLQLSWLPLGEHDHGLHLISLLLFFFSLHSELLTARNAASMSRPNWRCPR